MAVIRDIDMITLEAQMDNANLGKNRGYALAF